MNLARKKNLKFWHKETKAFRINSQSGQAGIILVLITVVLVTISLSIASRSVTDISISRQEGESSRAFNAAEAGIEDALRQDITSVTSGNVSVGGITANYTITPETDIDFYLDELETAEIDLSTYAGNDVVVMWGTVGQDCSLASPNPFASIVIKAGGTFPYSGAGCSRPGGVGTPDGFDSDPANVTSAPANTERAWQVTVGVSSVDALRIRAVYVGANVRVESDGTSSLPVQAWTIHSEAQTAGGESRAVEVTQQAPAPPSIFDFVIFSGAGDLSK